MKFMTRDLYDQMVRTGLSDDEAVMEEFRRRWEQTWSAYREQLSRLQSSLPPGARELANTTFHDGVVVAVDRPDPSTLRLKIDATRNPWGPIGVFLLTFTGVCELETPEDFTGDIWLYEEMHPHHESRFEFSVLFSHTDLRVAADEVEIMKLA